MPLSQRSLVLADEAATVALGAALGATLTQMHEAIAALGLHIALPGDLGAGKTTLVRALLRHLGFEEAVKSPTFTLLESYVVSRLHLYHFDFYRFKSPREFLDGGFSEHFTAGAVCIVEWPDRAGTYLPPVDLQIRLQLLDPGREAVMVGQSHNGAQCLELLWTKLKDKRGAA